MPLWQAPPLRLQEAPQPQLRHERRPSLAEDEALARRLQVGCSAGAPPLETACTLSQHSLLFQCQHAHLMVAQLL